VRREGRREKGEGRRERGEKHFGFAISELFLRLPDS
jgi:hypothetical protein